MGARVFGGEEEDATVDCHDDGDEREDFEVVDEGALVGSHFDIEVDEGHQEQEEHQGLHDVTDRGKEDRDEGHRDLPHNYKQLPVVAARLVALEDETVLLESGVGGDVVTLVVEQQPHTQRHSHHPQQHSQHPSRESKDQVLSLPAHFLELLLESESASNIDAAES